MDKTNNISIIGETLAFLRFSWLNSCSAMSFKERTKAIKEAILKRNFNILPVIFILLLTFAGCSPKHALPQVITKRLNATWQFREASGTVWHPAKVPGTVQTDLLRNKLIPNPFYGTNESKLQWIGKKTGFIKLDLM